MPRNLGMLRWAEGHRRSPRISALEVCKAQKTRQEMGGSGGLEGPVSAFRTKTRRGRKKRKRQPSEDDESYGHGSQEDHPSDFDQPEESSKLKGYEYDDETGQQSAGPLVLPKKQILELILDTLQRRDSYDIFAQPVDPNEVDDYYEIIEEPMDFGTMRAKLHEGLYGNFQQFEHDTFLITKNAMHFNSSSSLYFRQARAIHELTKKVFHILKTDPKDFERQFSGTRRRSTRKLTKLVNCRESFSNTSFRKVVSRPGSAAQHEPSKTLRCSSSLQSRNRSSHTGSAFSATSYGRKQSDRRSTYMPLSSLLTDSSSIFTATMPCNLEPLMLVNQPEFSYAESLMSFTKNLGPTAQRVAQRKLQGFVLSSCNPYHSLTTPQNSLVVLSSQPREVYSSIILEPNDKSDIGRATPKTPTLRDHLNRRPVVLGCTTSELCSSLVNARKKATVVDQRSSHCQNLSPDNCQKTMATYAPVVLGGERARTQSGLSPFSTSNQMRMPSTAPKIYHMDNCTTKRDESVPNMVHPWVQPNHGNLQNISQAGNHGDPFHAGPSHLSTPSTHFKFDLMYLKTKLDQMKPVEQQQERLAHNPGGFTIPIYPFQSEGDFDNEAKGTAFWDNIGKLQGSIEDGFPDLFL